MKRLETRLEGPALIEPVVHGDERGFFHESYRRTTVDVIYKCDAYYDESIEPSAPHLSEVQDELPFVCQG